LEDDAMKASLRLCSGKADPFGVLVLAVALALLVTVGIQAQASSGDGRLLYGPVGGCAAACAKSAADPSVRPVP
jgi:hypothetical protein